MELSTQFIDINSIKPRSYDNLDKKNLKSDKALKDVCNNFESFFMNQILEVSLKSTNIAGDGTGSDIIKGMYTDALSQSSSGSMGISDMLYKFLSETKA